MQESNLASENPMSQLSKRTEESSAKWKIRPMRHDDVARCLEIWLQVELTEASSTASSILATDPAGFYVAELEDGQVVGMCAGPMTRPDTAFMGFYAVDPKFQGIGVGRELWAKTIERLDSSKNIGLYGVPTMSDKYKKSGFRVEDSTRMLIYESTYNDEYREQKKHDIFPERLRSLEDLDLKITSGCYNNWMLIGSTEISHTTGASLFDQLVEYDKGVNQFSRRDLLKSYLLGDDVPLTIVMLMPGENSKQKFGKAVLGDDTSVGTAMRSADESTRSRTFQGQNYCAVEESKPADQSRQQRAEAALSSSALQYLSISPEDPSESAGDDLVDENQETLQIVGYGCVRHDNTGGGMIGPVYANSDDYCEIILKQLIKYFPLQLGGKYSVMSLTSNIVANDILDKIGLRQIDQCSRMFTKYVPRADLSRIYYVHSPNFTLF